VRKNLPQIGSKSLLWLMAAFLLRSSFVDLERVAAETQEEQTVNYTIASASLAPRDLGVFIANAEVLIPSSSSRIQTSTTTLPSHQMGSGLPLLHATSLRIKSPPGLLYRAYL
jgi:hypothetical protein